MVVDVHVHCGNMNQWNPQILEWMRKVNGDFSPFDQEGVLRQKAFVEMMDRVGVDYAVILPEVAPAVTGNITTDDALEFCKGCNRLLPFVSINIHFSREPLREFERYLSMGCRGLKVHPVHQLFYPNDPRLYPLYELAQSAGVPVMFHTGSSIFPGAKIKYGDPIYLDEIAVDFPKLTIIMSHGGRGFWYDKAQFLTQIRPNVYIDICGLPPHKLLDLFPKLERLHHKFLFGSDWPGGDIKRSIEGILALPISNEAKEAILYKNALRLLRIEKD